MSSALSISSTGLYSVDVVLIVSDNYGSDVSVHIFNIEGSYFNLWVNFDLLQIFNGIFRILNVKGVGKRNIILHLLSNFT
jgi:hypothetical protein